MNKKYKAISNGLSSVLKQSKKDKKKGFKAFIEANGNRLFIELNKIETKASQRQQVLEHTGETRFVGGTTKTYELELTGQRCDLEHFLELSGMLIIFRPTKDLSLNLLVQNVTVEDSFSETVKIKMSGVCE